MCFHSVRFYATFLKSVYSVLCFVSFDESLLKYFTDMKEMYNTTRMISLPTLECIFKIIRKSTVYRYIKRLGFICRMWRKRQHYDLMFFGISNHIQRTMRFLIIQKSKTGCFSFGRTVSTKIFNNFRKMLLLIQPFPDA